MKTRLNIIFKDGDAFDGWDITPIIPFYRTEEDMKNEIDYWAEAVCGNNDDWFWMDWDYDSNRNKRLEVI